MIEYVVVFTQEEDGRYSVFAPDLPGCATWGNTKDEARKHIREAIELWIESAKSDGDPIPEPGSRLEVVAIANSRGARVVAHLKGKGDVSMSTDEIISLTRGD